MTSANFIRHGQDSLCTLESANDFFNVLESACAEFDSIYYSKKVQNDKDNFDVLFKEDTDINTSAFTEGAVTELISNLGKFIKKIFEKLIEFINKGLDRIRDWSFRLKNTEKKLNELLKKHPELRDEELFSYDKVRFSDMKGISDLDKEYDRIMALINAQKNPKSLRAKWEKAVVKFNDGKGSFNTVLNVVKGVAAVVSLAVGITTLRNAYNSTKDDCSRRKGKVHEVLVSVSKKIEDADGFIRNETWTEIRSTASKTNNIYESAKDNDEIAERIKFVQEVTRDYAAANTKYCTWRLKNVNQMISEAESFCNSKLKVGEKND